MWDKKTEDMSSDEISDESVQRLKDNLFNLDRHLAPYPYEIWQKWKLLSSQITGEELLSELTLYTNASLRERPIAISVG